MNKEIKFEEKLNKIVSFVVLLTAIGLIVFMFVQSVTGVLSFFSGVIHSFSVDISAGAGSDGGGIHEHVSQWLQAVATIVILVKAYRVLMSYVKTHHLSIRYLLEINFTASSLELLFNSASYDLEMKIIFLILGLASLLIYLLFKKQILDYESK